MRRFLAFAALYLIAFAVGASLVACDQKDIGARVEQGGKMAQDAGTSLGIPLLALAGSIASGIGALLAGKKASVGQTYAHAPFTLEEGEEMAQLFVRLGYIAGKPKA